MFLIATISVKTYWCTIRVQDDRLDKLFSVFLNKSGHHVGPVEENHIEKNNIGDR